LLVSWCASDRCGMVGSDEDRGKSSRPGAEDWGWPSIGRVLGGRMIGRSGDIVCNLHRERRDEEHRFPSSDSKPRSMVYQWFDLKTTRTVCQWFGLKTTVVCQWFGLKTTGMVC
jgi:hypothetical protein